MGACFVRISTVGNCSKANTRGKGVNYVQWERNPLSNGLLRGIINFIGTN